MTEANKEMSIFLSGYMCVINSLCCIPKINTALKIIYTPMKIFLNNAFLVSVAIAYYGLTMNRALLQLFYVQYVLKS